MILQFRSWAQWLSTAALVAACSDAGTQPSQGGQIPGLGTSNGNDVTPSNDGTSVPTGLAAAGAGNEPIPAEELIPIEEDPFDGPPELSRLPDGLISELGDEIDIILNRTGGSFSALIVAEGTGQVVYQRDPDRAQKPASNTKLLTTASAMVGLGVEYHQTSRVVATDDATDGVVSGDLILIGDHDYSLSSRFFDNARFLLDVLADELATAGLSRVTGTVQAWGEFVYEGNSVGYYNPSAHRNAVASAFRAALIARGIDVEGPSATGALFEPPAGALDVLDMNSLPLSVSCFPTNVVSHNEFADILSRHLGFVTSGESSYAAGTARTLQEMEKLGVDINGLLLNDGSGLSHDNRVSARQLVQLFQAMDTRPEGPLWQHTFSVAGVRGTLANRMTGSDTVGRFWGKTGSLSGVITLSGILHHRYDGRRYYFSLLNNGVSNPTGARAALDDVVRAVARDYGSETPLPAPVLSSVLNGGNDGSVRVSWEPVEDAIGYLVWRSSDGKVWNRDEARLVRTTSHRTLPLDGAKTLYVRISALGDASESIPSDVYGTRIASGRSPILLVDGNDRFQAQPMSENLLGVGHDFMVVTAEALEQRTFDTVDNDAVGSGVIDLTDYETVLWSLGEESTDNETFDDVEQEWVRAFIDSGGSLFVSGAELGWDLDEAGSANDRAFLQEVLGARYRGDDSGTVMARGVGPLAALGSFSFLSPGRMDIDYPDQLEPYSAAGQAISSYVRGLGGGAGVVTEVAAQRVVVLGFPLESVDGPERRTALVDLVFAP